MTNITLTQAQDVLRAALQKAEEIAVPMNVAIIDAGMNLKAFARQDNAWLGSIDIAIKKANTARMFDMDSGAIGTMSQPGQPLYGIEVSNGGLISFPGGVLLRSEGGEIVGAIGVSGGQVDQDLACAHAGTAVLQGVRI